MFAVRKKRNGQTPVDGGVSQCHWCRRSMRKGKTIKACAERTTREIRTKSQSEGTRWLARSSMRVDEERSEQNKGEYRSGG